MAAAAGAKIGSYTYALMFRASLFLVAWLVAGFPASVRAGEPAGLASGAATTFETEHFRVICAGTRPQVHALAARLEAVYRVTVRLARELHIDTHVPDGKLEVVWFSNYSEYQNRLRAAGLDDSTLGYFDAAQNRCVFFNFETHPDVVRLRRELAGLHEDDWARRKRLSDQIAASLAGMNARVVQHEAAHMIQANVGLIPRGSNPPTWLVEGLAELFELPFVERGASIALSVNRYRLHEFQKLHGGDERLAELRRLVAGETWRGGPDYSLAWALTNYLYVRQRLDFAAYVKAVTAPAGASTAPNRLEQFESIFGPLDSGFAARFDAYVARLMARNLALYPQPVRASP